MTHTYNCTPLHWKKNKSQKSNRLLRERQEIQQREREWESVWQMLWVGWKCVHNNFIQFPEGSRTHTHPSNKAMQLTASTQKHIHIQTYTLRYYNIGEWSLLKNIAFFISDKRGHNCDTRTHTSEANSR